MRVEKRAGGIFPQDGGSPGDWFFSPRSLIPISVSYHLAFQWARPTFLWVIPSLFFFHQYGITIAGTLTPLSSLFQAADVPRFIGNRKSNPQC